METQNFAVQLYDITELSELVQEKVLHENRKIDLGEFRTEIRDRFRKVYIETDYNLLSLLTTFTYNDGLDFIRQTIIESDDDELKTIAIHELDDFKMITAIEHLVQDLYNSEYQKRVSKENIINYFIQNQTKFYRNGEIFTGEIDLTQLQKDN